MTTTTTRMAAEVTTNDTESLKPGILRVIRRDGTITPYNDDKIKVAMTKAFLAVEGEQATGSERIHELVNQLTDQISERFIRNLHHCETINIEDIQDQVELVLMRAGEQKVARSYVLYREDRRKMREAANATQKHQKLNVTLKDGKTKVLDQKRLEKIVMTACQNLEYVEPHAIIKDTMRSLFDGMPFADVSKALILAARTQIEREPNYTYVTARLLLDNLRSEALSFLGLKDNATFDEMAKLYPKCLSATLKKGISLGLLDKRLETEFDLEKLGKALLPKRDLNFTYLSLQTLYDRYFLHSNDIRFELPQTFYMRVAMGLALDEENKTEKAIEFYQLLSSFDYMSSTPTLFNSGTQRSQLSSCYLTTVPDDLEGIYGAIRDNALLSKYAGGLGNDWTPVRAMGATIKGTNGKSQGVVPFLNVADATAIAVNQGGKRKGAVCAYLETWHMDIEEFLDLRKNTGDERRRTHDMNTANWIPDLFMKRVAEKGEWTLFSPDDTPELHDLYGDEFEKMYRQYEDLADAGEIQNYKRIPAVNLWRKMLTMLFETGHPWVTFKDPCNLRSPQQHVGVVHSSNLCTEITLNTSKDEIAVCNLGSINIPAHLDGEGNIDKEKLRKTVNTAIRMLDNVIDINFYSVPQARNSNLKHRPIGLGLMGFQDALYKKGISYASDEAVEFADETMELISYYAIEASTNLAEERGAYETFKGSLWSKGILPIDSIENLAKTRGEYLEQDRTQRLDWKTLRERVQKVGMRNSNVMAIAPTATISNISGVSQSIEPTYQNLYVKSNLSGEFTVINPYLVEELRKLDLWDEVMVNDLKYYDGSVQKIERIPQHLKAIFSTAFEIDPRWLVDAASRRQKWIDQGQSLNLYMAQPSGKKLDSLYQHAWRRGLKTTYYLRSMGATSTEKSTINDAKLNAVQMNPAPKACSIDDPDCEACQ
ncbi:MAG: ribonucleoside-diphosphate reductase subunit alpha [Gammaproteobacteria bacterium]